MKKDEIENLLDQSLTLRREPVSPPSLQDWDLLRSKFRCEFDPDFVTFHEIVGNYWFLGELLSVNSSDITARDDTIQTVYDQETSYGRWPANMIPFYAVGNGDYQCIDASLGADSPTYYVYHEDSHIEEEYSSFETWLRDPHTLKV